MDMVERVARAMEKNPGSVELIQGEAEHLARVAIEAMREPSQPMIDVGDMPKFGIRQIWQAMIDAALKKA